MTFVRTLTPIPSRNKGLKVFKQYIEKKHFDLEVLVELAYLCVAEPGLGTVNRGAHVK